LLLGRFIGKDVGRLVRDLLAERADGDVRGMFGDIGFPVVGKLVLRGARR
jgi:hypothetical protein